MNYSGWLISGLVTLGVVVAACAVLAVLARRLPPGILHELVAFLPDCITVMRRLRKDPRVPRSAKVAVVCAALWIASPIDLIPDFIPVIGILDDVIVVALVLRYAGRMCPRDVLFEAWPGEPRLVEWLLGSAR